MTSSGPSAPTEEFASSGRWVGFAGLAVLAAMAASLASTGLSTGTWAAIVGLAVLGLGTWTSYLRPRVAAHRDHLEVRNNLLDTYIPWTMIEGVDVRQTLRIRTPGRTVHAIAVGKSTRQLIRRGGTPPGGGLMGPAGRNQLDKVQTREGMHYADYVALRVRTLAQDARASSQDDGAELTRRWAVPETTVLVVLVVLLVVLLLS